MKRALVFVLASAVAIAISHAASAADARLPIFHSFIGDDALGKRFDSFLGEYFKRSPKFREVADRDESAFDLYITTLDPAGRRLEPGRNLRTVYSYAVSGKALKTDTVFNVYIRSVLASVRRTNWTVAPQICSTM
jgi:hypothetical protein